MMKKEQKTKVPLFTIILSVIVVLVFAFIGIALYLNNSDNQSIDTREVSIEEEEYKIRDVFDNQTKLVGRCESFDIEKFGISVELIRDAIEGNLEYNVFFGLIACSQVDQEVIDQIYSDFQDYGDQCFVDYEQNKSAIDDAYLLLLDTCSDNNLTEEEYNRLLDFLREQEAKGIVEL